MSNNTHVIARGDRQLTLAIKPGYHLAQVIALLNWHEASIQDREIICYPESASDGYYVLADIVENKSGEETGPWATLGSEQKACAGSCSGCGCNCACTSATCCRK